jgi:hypothetical protein
MEASTESTPVPRPSSDAALRLVLLHDETGAEIAIPAGDVLEVRSVHPDILTALRGEHMDAGAEVVIVDRQRAEARSSSMTFVLETVAQVITAHDAALEGWARPSLMVFRAEDGTPRLVRGHG